MQQKTKNRTLFLCRGALVAALYVLLTMVARLFGLDSGVIQVRLSEALCVLPLFFSEAIPGLTVGCLLANLLGGSVWLDVLVGPVATLLGALGTYWLRRYPWLAATAPVLANALIIPFVLCYGYGMEQAIPLMMLTVGAGELISVMGLGMSLYYGLRSHVGRLARKA